MTATTSQLATGVLVPVAEPLFTVLHLFDAKRGRHRDVPW